MINEKQVMSEVKSALEEDVGVGDVSAALLPETMVIQATIVSREPMVVAGIPWVQATCQAVDPRLVLDWYVSDSQVLSDAQPLCTISGKARSILTAERTMLNFLQTLSGTATKTYRYVKALGASKTKLLDTRKTLPGLRHAQKYAVRCGGGVNHRFGLYDAYLIKENHIRALGSLTSAIEAARATQDQLLIEVEVEDLQQLKEALAAQPDRILLDNFTLDWLEQAVKMNHPHCCDLEASGGITLDNIASVAQTGVEWISVGDLTKSVESIDLSLLVE